MRFRGFITGLLLLLVACAETPQVTEFSYAPEINVFALLLLNNQQKIIHIEQSYPVTEVVPENRGIADARVTITSDNQAVPFSHLVNGLYVEAADVLQLMAGKKYRLQIVLSDGRQVRGECTIPHPPGITTPQPGIPVPAYTAVEIAWESKARAPRYQVSVRGNMFGFSAEVGTDSLHTTFYPFLLAQPDIYVLKVAALDANYHDYLRVAEDQPPLFRLQGALGVFGAMSHDEVILIAQ